ncbi:MAG TPA: hypothetical protein VME43_08460 [Bryobacteraceae bacterium]|nr:hypothetical protein [Bryobacteraceae bacterium]
MVQQLDREDARFEEFMSMAAHNLRESLRDVTAFSQLLAEACAGRLDSAASGCLDRIRDGSQKMQSLLADVVDYWSSTAGDRQSSPIEMEAVLCQALLSLDPLLAERRAIVTHDPLPRVYGDFALLSKVLHHLVRNAIADCESPFPRVHISSPARRFRLGFFHTGQRLRNSSGVPGPYFSEHLSACTERNAPATDSGWHSARKPSSGTGGASGSNRHPERDRRFISPRRQSVNSGLTRP